MKLHSLPLLILVVVSMLFLPGSALLADEGHGHGEQFGKVVLPISATPKAQKAFETAVAMAIENSPAGGRPAMRGHVVQVMKKVGGRWLVLEAHPKLFPPPPAQR